MAPGASANQGVREFNAPRTTAKPFQQSMPVSSNNHDIREFCAPPPTEPLKTSQQQLMPRVEHQSIQRPIKPLALHTTNRTRPDDNHQMEAGFLGEIRNYKAGDEFVLLWKWVDNFMDNRRTKVNSSSHTVNQSTSRQPKPTSSIRVGRQVQRPVVTPSPEAVRRQATDREVMREYKAQRHTPWGELSYLYQNWKDQQAKKKADRAKQRKAEEIARSQVTDHSTNPLEPRQQTPSAPDQDAQPDVAGNPKPVYNKKRGEVLKHKVIIAQLPPVHNSVHLQRTPSNNYRTGPSHDRDQKNRSTRDTHFSDFLHHPNAPPSQKTGIPKCYICGSSDCAGGYRDIISRLWVCHGCQKSEGIEPVQCAVCGQPSSPDSGYASGNGLWMCSSCRDPTTPKELPPSPKLARKGTSRPKASRPPIPQGVDKAKSGDICECDNPCPPIETFDNKKISICPNCDERLTPFPVLLPKSASHTPLPSEGLPISEYNSDHLYSDDGWEPRKNTPPSQKSIGLGITFQDSEEEEEEKGREEDFRPTPPLKDRKYYHDSPILPAMDYNQSYLRKPGAKHPYAPSSPASPPPPPPTRTLRRKASVVSFAQALPKAKPSSKKYQKQRPQQPPSFNPTTYPYQSPPTTPPTTSLHKPRPASSVYPTDEQPPTNFPYPPPPIPQRFVNRPQRSSSVDPGVLSKAALARPMASPRSQSSSVSVEWGRNRRSSWYDFWKPVFETRGERSP